MAAGQNTPPAGGSEKSSWLTILVPAAGVGSLVILVAVVAGLTDTSSPTGKSKDSKSGESSVASGDSAPFSADKLTDGTSPTADDPGLKDIGDGLKIRDLKEGTGPVCSSRANVKAHYTGWLTSGMVFDSSRRRGEPSDFSLDKVVRGWKLGIPGMRVGGIRKLVIPGDLAYGSEGRPGIPPNATLIFEVELIAINKG